MWDLTGRWRGRVQEKRGNKKAGSDTLYLHFPVAGILYQFFRKSLLRNPESWGFVMLVVLKQILLMPWLAPLEPRFVFLEMLTAAHLCYVLVSLPPGSLVRPPPLGSAGAVMSPGTTLNSDTGNSRDKYHQLLCLSGGQFLSMFHVIPQRGWTEVAHCNNVFLRVSSCPVSVYPHSHLCFQE